MNEDFAFLQKHRSRGALFDANLLIVYLVGKMGSHLLKQYPHTKQYEDDYPLVEKLVESFPILYTTPNVLTEVSNLGRKAGPQFFAGMRAVVRLLDERYCASRDAVENARFASLGLTDSGLMIVASEVLVVTADFPLYSILRAHQLDAVNFHHLRHLSWHFDDQQ
ncbi:MAG: hypothetical protein JST93_25400 [Acidobacteria bacterium]|nr:hypothetical protein [Acidobacteriota bacterium]